MAHLAAVSSPEPSSQQGPILTEVIGLALLLLGAGLIVGAAFSFDVRLGVASTGVALIAVGTYLSRSEVI